MIKQSGNEWILIIVDLIYFLIVLFMRMVEDHSWLAEVGPDWSRSWERLRWAEWWRAGWAWQRDTGGRARIILNNINIVHLLSVGGEQ